MFLIFSPNAIVQKTNNYFTMRKRKELPELNDSLFKKIENRKLSFIVGGKATSSKVQTGIGKGGPIYSTQIDD